MTGNIRYTYLIRMDRTVQRTDIKYNMSELWGTYNANTSTVLCGGTPRKTVLLWCVVGFSDICISFSAQQPIIKQHKISIGVAISKPVIFSGNFTCIAMRISSTIRKLIALKTFAAECECILIEYNLPTVPWLSSIFYQTAQRPFEYNLCGYAERQNFFNLVNYFKFVGIPFFLFFAIRWRVIVHFSFDIN